MSGTSCLMPAGDLLRRYLQDFLVELPSVLKGDDREALHRMRVASRRLRAALRVFDGVIPHAKVTSWRKAMRRAGCALGQGRQLDVQLRFLMQAARARKNAQHRAGLEAIAGELKKKRAHAQENIRSVLHDRPVRRVLRGLKVYLAQDLRQAGGYTQKEGIFQPEEIARRRLEKLLQYAPYVHMPQKTRKLHLMRIAAKNVRYTLEILALRYGRKMHKYIRAARTLQDVLGDLHEMDVWLAYFLGARLQYARDLCAARACMLLRAQCLTLRARIYAKFLREWHAIESENTWKQLKRTLLKNNH